MHADRAATIRHAWDDFEMGYLSRTEAESIELWTIQEQRREREREGALTLIVDCRRCGAPIELPSLAYRGDGRHSCTDCQDSGATGWPRVDEDDERGGRR